MAHLRRIRSLTVLPILLGGSAELKVRCKRLSELNEWPTRARASFVGRSVLLRRLALASAVKPQRPQWGQQYKGRASLRAYSLAGAITGPASPHALT